MTIPLIDKLDNFEIVLNQIAAILAAETLAQQALAVLAGKDPALFTFDVFLNRYNPVEVFESNSDATPIVNVWYDNSNFPENKSNTVGQQLSQSSYNLDIYAGAASSDDPGGGYNRGDEESSQNLQRIIRLVRNIIMHPDNTYLQLSVIRGSKTQNLIWQRWIQSFQAFQPQIDDRPTENVVASRCTLQVMFNETPVIETFNPLEIVFITAKRAEDGKIIFETEFDTT